MLDFAFERYKETSCALHFMWSKKNQIIGEISAWKNLAARRQVN